MIIISKNYYNSIIKNAETRGKNILIYVYKSFPNYQTTITYKEATIRSEVKK
jgi:translation initiation factor 2B subunit (eIF-2B alpha/beta/delta family)